MATKTHPTPESLSAHLFVFVILGTVGFFGAMALLLTFLKP